MQLQENDNQRRSVAMVISIGFHAVVLLIFASLMAWTPPDPPLPEVGIQLNFGLDAAGFGEDQPQQEVGDQGEETSAEETQEPTPQENAVTESTEVTSEAPSKDPESVQVKEPKTEPVKETKKPVEEKKEKPQEQKEQQEALYKKPDANAKKGAEGNQGDQKGKTGDQGDPEGDPDAKALYGKNGGGNNGSSLSLSGWKWDRTPNPPNPGNEQGRLVFEIKVDDNGEIMSIKKLEGTVSPEIEKLYLKEIERLTFTQTGPNVPPVSTGTITFIIRAQ